MFDKRIAMFMSVGDFAVRSGIGSWCLSFLHIAKANNWKVDIITTDNVFSMRKSAEFANLFDCEIKYPLDKEKSRNPWTISLEGLQIADVLAYEQTFVEQAKTVLYDMAISNNPESLFALMNLGILDHLHTVYITHSPHLVWSENTTKYKNPYWYNFERNLLQNDKVTIGTHTTNNVETLKDMFDQHPVVFPTHSTVNELLIKDLSVKSGVLFIGRYEDRKNPKMFIDMIKETGLPAKILCGSKHDKWHAEFEKAGITDYTIVKATGKAKADFINSAKVAYHPANSESFGLGAFETAHQVFTILPEEHSWTQAFKDFPSVKIVSKSDINKTITKLYNETPDVDEFLSFVDEYNKNTIQTWYELLESTTKYVNKKVQIVKHIEENGPTSVNEWWKLKKRVDTFDISEVKTLYNNTYFVQKYDDTFLT